MAENQLQYDKRQQEFGNELGMFAPYDTATGTYEDVQLLTGMNTFTFTEPDRPDAIRRDNRDHVRLPSNESSTVEMAISQLPKTFREKIMGHRMNPNGSWSRGFKTSPFYLAYVQKVVDENDVVTRKLNVFYNAKFTKTGDLESEVDSEADLSVNADVSNADWVVVDGKSQAYTYVYDTDEGGKELIDYALAGNIIYPDTIPEGQTVSVKGVSVTPATLELTEGESGNLTANVAPTNATNKTVAWSVVDESVATIDDNGIVSAIKAGETEVTATTADGGFKASATVTVVAAKK